MKHKKDITEEINEALNTLVPHGIIAFLKDIIPLFELYDISDEEDWVKNQVGEENERNVRLIRTVYLMSKIAENHTAVLASLKIKHPNLWQRIRKHVDSVKNTLEESVTDSL